MPTSTPDMLAEADVRFLQYRLEVIGHWPASTRKTVMTEAISRRLTSIARYTYPASAHRDLHALSCQLLDDIFARQH